MNKFDFAAGVIKASPLARLTDRAFCVPVLFVCVVWIAALQGKTTIDNAIEFTKWVLVTFTIAEKAKDGLTSYGALTGGVPQSVAVGAMTNEAGAGTPDTKTPEQAQPTPEASSPPEAPSTPKAKEDVPILGSREVETFALGDLP